MGDKLETQPGGDADAGAAQHHHGERQPNHVQPQPAQRRLMGTECMFYYMNRVHTGGANVVFSSEIVSNTPPPNEHTQQQGSFPASTSDAHVSGVDFDALLSECNLSACLRDLMRRHYLLNVTVSDPDQSGGSKSGSANTAAAASGGVPAQSRTVPRGSKKKTKGSKSAGAAHFVYWPDLAAGNGENISAEHVEVVSVEEEVAAGAVDNQAENSNTDESNTDRAFQAHMDKLVNSSSLMMYPLSSLATPPYLRVCALKFTAKGEGGEVLERRYGLALGVLHVIGALQVRAREQMACTIVCVRACVRVCLCVCAWPLSDLPVHPYLHEGVRAQVHRKG